MSEFAKLMTMKLIELERTEKKFEAGGGVYPFSMIENHAVFTRNLNVRTPVFQIAQIEVLASMLGLSKAELVMEILESALVEVREMLEKDGRVDLFLKMSLERLRDHYGVNVEQKEESKDE